MENVATIINATGKLYELVANSRLAAGFMIVGLLLAVATCLITITLLKADADKRPVWLRIGFFACLAASLLLVSTAPAVSWIELTRSGIRRVPLAHSFANLEKNSRVTWAIRLIAYDPHDQEGLSASRLTRLGPSTQLYTFVANYHELRGYLVHDAVRMVGGNIRAGQHVSAIIFPVRFDLTPANARGLLQIINDVQADPAAATEQRLDMSSLTQSEIASLKNRDTLVSWSWEGYAADYPRFCELAQQFRCRDYSARRYIGGINQDWMPLGFARKEPAAEDVCGPHGSDVCEISTWDSAASKYEAEFGARVFLVRNYAIADLADPYLIDFEEPDSQVIPDIGVPDPDE